MDDHEFGDILDRLRRQRDEAAEAERERAANEERLVRLRDECEGVASFSPDRLVLAAGREPDEDDLWVQWAWRWRALSEWLARNGMRGRLEGVGAEDDPAALAVLAWLARAGLPGGLSAVAASLKSAANEPGLLRSVLATLRGLPSRLSAAEAGLRPEEQSSTTQTAAPGGKGRPVPDEEANIRVRQYLKAHPQATSRQVAKEVGIALGRVSELPAWQAALGRRKVSKGPPRKTTRRLTPKMLETIGRESDPLATLEAREAAWAMIFKAAVPEKQEELLGMTRRERESVIDAYLQMHDVERP